MKTEISQQQIDSYNQNGFLIIEDFLNPEELDNWRMSVTEAVNERLADPNDRLNNQGMPDAFDAQVFTQVLKLADSHPAMHRIMHDPSIGQVLAKIYGVDGIRIWHDQALFKPPYGNPTAWHLDSPTEISLWVALDDATVENGCLWYVPGSHKTARYDKNVIAGGQNNSDLFRVYPEWRSIEPVPAKMRAGSVVIHDGLTAHGAGANMTNKPRRAMTCAYMSDGVTMVSRYPDQIFFGKIKVGDVLDDTFNDIAPLLYSSKKEPALR